MDKHFQHALVLLQQGRFDLAEDKLRQCLAADPEHSLAHVFLSRCLFERDDWKGATDEARQAIRLEPALPLGHVALARALSMRNRLDEAEAAIQEALRLEPGDADAFATLAQIHFSQRDWPATLHDAEQGLAQEPDHIDCNNLRAMALIKLGRNAEAGTSIGAALARDPEDAFSHANQGWALLHEGKRQKALEHFREALRLEPGLEFAKAGIVEALKSKNFIYALMLRYFLWMGRLSRRTQWAVVLGGVVGYQVLRRVADQNPVFAPWIWPVLLSYLGFVLMTWLAGPLFNLLLRLDRFGRHALTHDERLASNWVGSLLGLALLCGIAYLATDNPFAALGAIYFAPLVLPVNGVFACDRGWPRRIMALYACSLAVIGLASLPLAFLTLPLGHQALEVFLWGCMLSTFVTNFLAMQSPRS
jgi:tetratricopeptide (TPR) repeat protein